MDLGNGNGTDDSTMSLIFLIGRKKRMKIFIIREPSSPNPNPITV